MPGDGKAKAQAGAVRAALAEGGEHLLGAALRHHHGGIPAQHARRTAKCVQAAELLFELLVRSLRHGWVGLPAAEIDRMIEGLLALDTCHDLDPVFGGRIL